MHATVLCYRSSSNVAQGRYDLVGLARNSIVQQSCNRALLLYNT
jgi:hypothetical protein